MSWAKIQAEANQLAENSDELFRLYIQSSVLDHDSFESALVTIIAAPLSTVIPKASFTELLLSVYQVSHVSDDLVSLSLLDIKVSASQELREIVQNMCCLGLYRPRSCGAEPPYSNAEL
jgi:hypothetical protein